MKVLPNGESLIISVFCDGYFSLSAALALRDGLCGTDPRHVARCFIQSGHASHRTPSESYLSAWPFWYAAVMRSTQVGQRIQPSLANASPGHTDQLLRTERSRFGKQEIDEWRWALEPPRRQRKPVIPDTISHVQVQKYGIAELSENPLVTFKYGVLRVLEVEKAAAEQEAKLGRSKADLVDLRLKFAPSFKSIHKRTPGRTDKQDRPRRSAVRKILSDAANELLNFIHARSKEDVRALENLLTNECTHLTVNDVTYALNSLPINFNLEICWPRGCLDTNLASKLKNLRRVAGLNERKHVTKIRVRVVPPGTDVSDHLITHMTTITRSALTVRKLLSTSI